MLDDGYKNVAAGIIEVAVDDYRKALRIKNSGQIRALQNFFLSDWGQALSENNGHKIIERVRKEVAEKSRNILKKP